MTDERSLDSREHQQLQTSQRLFSSENIKSYVAVLMGFITIIILYHLLTGIRQFPGPGTGPPEGGRPGNHPLFDSLQAGENQGFVGLMDIWPLWGSIISPTLTGLVLGILTIVCTSLIVWYIYEKREMVPKWIFIAFLGFILIVLTNLIQGWTTGIYSPIGGGSEIFYDAVNVSDIITFVSNYSSIQQTLSLHAQTQPPGAVLAIYLLYLLLSSPDLIALAVAAIATFMSAFFLDKFFNRILEKDIARYGLLLFVLLPAVQVYYLANIYAIVATMMFGTLYFYFHPNQYLKAIGSIACIFIGTFISFLFVYVGLFLLIFEILRTGNPRTSSISSWSKTLLKNLSELAIVVAAVGSLYLLLYLTIGFNYIDAFLYASDLENPNGFMLLSNPGNYFLTRVQNILDIMIFFGPVLIALCWKGLKILREQGGLNYQIVLSALLALLLLFLTGAPKKGETARICMFILPFLLIPVLEYLRKMQFSNRDKVLLAILVFLQTVVMQLFIYSLW